MAGGATITVTILGHQMFMHWCPNRKCLMSQPFVRVYMRIGQDASSKAFCLVCGSDYVPDDDGGDAVD